jgi:hypothetical protein
MALVRGFRITPKPTFSLRDRRIFPDVQLAISIKKKKKKNLHKGRLFYFRGKKAASSKEKYIVNVDIVFISAMTRALREVK